MRERFADEAGFGMVEVMVSAVVLLMLSLATFSLLDKSHATSMNQASRGVASNLAHADLDRVRQMDLDKATGLDQQRDEVINGIKFHVATKADWTSESNAIISCTSTDLTGGQYLRIASTVTWPGMGSMQPVTAESIMTPRAGDLSPLNGSLAVKVQDQDGHPLAGATVAVQGQTLVTGATGCVTFGQLAEGTSTMAFTAPGYVDQTSKSPGNDDVTIVRNQKSSDSVTLGLATDIPIAIKKNATTAAAWNHVTVKSDTFRKVYDGTASTASYTATDLYPWAGGWSVYAGDCIGNDPATYGLNTAAYSALFTDSSVASAPGATTATAGAYLQSPPSFTVKAAASGSPTLWYRFKVSTTATQMWRTPPETQCTGDTTRTPVPTSSGSGTVQAVPLPYGIWDGCVDNGTNKITFSSANNTPTGGTPAPTTSISNLDLTTSTQPTGYTRSSGTCP